MAGGSGCPVRRRSSGYGWNVPQPSLIREPPPRVVPLRIGVYHPPELRAFTYRHHLTDTTWVLGTPSVKLFNDALALLFVQVVEVPRPPSPAAPILDVAAVIEPRIVSAGFRYPRPDQRALSAHVIYVITLYAPHGAQLASWSIDGTAAEALDNPLDAVGIVKRSFEGAMSEAAWMLTTNDAGAPKPITDVAAFRRQLDGRIDQFIAGSAQGYQMFLPRPAQGK